ncbi:helix-turn-helix domain-containing protein [Xinfangfangia sp. D13-10-4-6]|uniref:helix-turn-helix domain-containing protein n=1 Tax=Pseudogemmobacter hezensis TaxID=2737662 RepID=UPI001556397A|nr:helix-turn-helix domain-containing protein [Pseudogemmobacter hezensis]NPD16454.1 helix-turn-helix domain-containing protein [Pseudogemmobacter hezensis]
MSHRATNWAFDQHGLKPSAKIVLLVLADYHNLEHGCFPTQAFLADACEMNRDTVNVQLALVEERGLALALFLRLMLPMSIGSYFGAVEVMGWPWWAGILAVLPGLLFIIPGLIANAFAAARRGADELRGHGFTVKEEEAPSLSLRLPPIVDGSGIDGGLVAGGHEVVETGAAYVVMQRFPGLFSRPGCLCGKKGDAPVRIPDCRADRFRTFRSHRAE